MDKKEGRVLFFHAEFPSGGGERVTRDIARGIHSYGYEVYVVTCWKKEGPSPEVTLLELPDKKVNTQKNAEAIIDVIQSLSIDIFVLPGFLWNYLGFVQKQVLCKFVYILHNIPLWEVIAKRERRKRTQGSVLKMLEWYLIAYPKFVWLKSYDKFYIKQYREVYDLVDAYVVLCDGYKTELEQILKLPKQNKISVIHNSERIIEDLNLDRKKKQIVFVGNMTYENKRVDRLLDIWGMIFERVPDWELVLVGGGQEKENLQKQSVHMGLKRVVFAGGTSNVQPYYDDASVFCLTSTFEGWPLCLSEAQANGVVPIAFNCCAGIEEMLSPSGVNGILISPFDMHEFADALYQLLISPELLDKMRRNVILKSHVYSLDKIGKQWVNLFESLNL